MRILGYTIILSMILLIVGASNLSAQLSPLNERVNIFSQNSISNMGGIGDTLWVGPQLARNIGNSFDWYIAQNADSVFNGRGRMFSIALAPDTIVAGLGFVSTTGGENVQTAMGFYTSIDGGNSWRFVPPPVDDINFTSFRYGGQDIPALAIVVPQQAPPFSVDFRGNTIFTASWALGIRRSVDFGDTWERILLPPYELDELTPEGTYDFEFNPRVPDPNSLMGQRYPLGWTNFVGFSVLIDDEGYVWAGTAGGLNISDNAMTAPTDSIRWRHIRATGGLQGMLGNWIIRMRQNPYDNQVWLTNWISNVGEKQALVSTSNKGLTFTQHLIDDEILDVTFNGATIFAAGRNGLFISFNNGTTWIKQPQIRSNNSFLKDNASFQSATRTKDRVWIGTNDGLISTGLNELRWEITRVDFPLRGGNIYQQDAPNVQTYAYPNPFSRTQHDIIRIRFETKSTGKAKIELFDFGMQPVITLGSLSIGQPGIYEVPWNGLDALGRRVANGPVFYRIQVDSDEITGKFLVLD